MYRRFKGKKVIEDFWLKHYVSDNGHCSLCGNHGVIDTRGRAITPAGVQCGALNYCICPNGNIMRLANEKRELSE